MKATKRQKELMGLIIAGNGDDWLDIDELIEALNRHFHVASKQSLQCSIRKLEAHGVLVRDYRTRRNRVRVVLVPTGKGYAQFGRPHPTSPTSPVSPVPPASSGGTVP